MGQTYSVNLKLNVSNENLNTCIHTLCQNNYLKNIVGYDMDDTIKTLLFAEEPYTQFEMIDGVYKASFDASYLYHSTLAIFMEIVALYAEDSSYMEVYPDNGYFRYEIQNQALCELSEGENISPFFDSGDDMYDSITLSQHGFYNEMTNTFVAQYSEAGDIIVYKISKELARECAREARANNDTWLRNLGPGGQIISADDAPEYLESILDDDTSEYWIYAGPLADFYALKDKKDAAEA